MKIESIDSGVKKARSQYRRLFASLLIDDWRGKRIPEVCSNADGRNCALPEDAINIFPEHRFKHPIRKLPYQGDQ